jgi:hypothetical protein
MLNALRNVSFVNTATWVQVHIGDPGAAGTSNPSAVTARQSITFSAASGGAIALSNTPSFSMTASETISHVSVHDASTAGNFLWSAALTTAKTVNNGDTLNLTTCGLALTPVAA